MIGHLESACGSVGVGSNMEDVLNTLIKEASAGKHKAIREACTKAGGKTLYEEGEGERERGEAVSMVPTCLAY